MADRYRSARHLVGGGQHFLNRLYAFGDAFRRPAGILNIEGMQALVLDKVLRPHQSGYLVCFAAQPNDKQADRKSTRLNSSHSCASRMPSAHCTNQMITPARFNYTTTK